MANRDNPYGFKAVRNLNDGAIPKWKGKLLSNTIVTSGDAVMAASGYVALTNIVATNAVLGVIDSIQATSITTTNPDVYFTPSMDGIVFRGQCSGAPTQATVFTNCDIEGTTGIMEINEDATSLNVVKVCVFMR